MHLLQQSFTYIVGDIRGTKSPHGGILETLIGKAMWFYLLCTGRSETLRFGKWPMAVSGLLQRQVHHGRVSKTFPKQLPAGICCMRDIFCGEWLHTALVNRSIKRRRYYLSSPEQEETALRFFFFSFFSFHFLFSFPPFF